jgi:hypothetical protein
MLKAEARMISPMSTDINLKQHNETNSHFKNL